MPDVFIDCYIDSFVFFFSHKVVVGKIASYPAKQTMHVNLRPFYGKKKLPRGRAVSAPDFGSRGRGFESRWRRDYSRT